SVSPHTRVYSRSDGSSPPSWRSFCSLSAMTPSAPSSARSRSGSYVVPAGVCPHRHTLGMSVGGPESVIVAPSGTSALMSDRATRLCTMSSTIRRRTARPSARGAAAPVGPAAKGLRPSLRWCPARPGSPRSTSRPCRGRAAVSTSCAHSLPCDQLDLVAAVHLGQVHADVVGGLGGHVLTDKVGADRKLTVAPVDEHRKTDGPRAPVV